MARRGDEAEPKAFEIVIGIAERMDLQLAAVAGAGVDLADRQRPAKPAAPTSASAASSTCGAGSVSDICTRLWNRSFRIRDHAPNTNN
jgi:hypothetical protein